MIHNRNCATKEVPPQSLCQGSLPSCSFQCTEAGNDVYGIVCAGHAYAAAISACAAGGEWGQAVKMFDNMMLRGIKPDVVSCTALITALAADGQWEHAEKVVKWMLNSGRDNLCVNDSQRLTAGYE